MNIQYSAKDEYLKNEGDAYFERNFELQKQQDASVGVKLFYDFFCNQMSGGYFPDGKKLLEIGCCYGYNLAYLKKNLDFCGYGIEPSRKAIAYGKQLFGDSIELVHGTADNLPYADDFFNVVLVGTCLYQVDRTLLVRTLAEIDRVLMNGGFLVISDFDPPFACKRENKHNNLTPVYKDNYGDMILHAPFNYVLVEKRSYSFGGALVFPIDIQDRMSTQILYKEIIYQ